MAAFSMSHLAAAASSQPESINTLFEPRRCPRFRSVPASELVVYNPRTQLSQLQKSTARKPRPHFDNATLVVFVSGGCRRATDTRDARASYGLYFGAGSLYNTSDLLDPALPQTIACAEVEALAAALGIIRFITMRYAKFNSIKLVTDSRYLVDAMSALAPDQQKQDSVNGQLRPPAHLDRLMALRKKIEAMENDDGIICQLWHMTEDSNAEAGNLAIEALNRA